MSGLSIVINTRNEGEELKRCLKSVRGLADEIIVCDMNSTDQTQEIAKKFGAKVILHEPLDYVEPARNFAISKASSDWILLLDPDEEVSPGLAEKIKEIVKKDSDISFVEIPRKNTIFGKWVKASKWWPDYNIRLFKKGKVKWSDEIHRRPETEGEGLSLPIEEETAIIHHHYESIGQFLERMNRYSTVQAEELKKDGYKFRWYDLIDKPFNEFLSRYFAGHGYEDGVHGLALSLLQAFSFLVVYLKVWEMEKFTSQGVSLSEFEKVSRKAGKDINYWFWQSKLSLNPFKRMFQKIGGRK